MINKRTVLLFRSLEYLPSICALSVRAIYRIYYGVNMETRGSSPVFTNFEVRRVWKKKMKKKIENLYSLTTTTLTMAQTPLPIFDLPTYPRNMTSYVNAPLLTLIRNWNRFSSCHKNCQDGKKCQVSIHIKKWKCTDAFNL